MICGFSPFRGYSKPGNAWNVALMWKGAEPGRRMFI
jgi:hypothetical protein